MTILSCIPGEHQCLLFRHQALALPAHAATRGLVQDWPPLRTTTLQLREGAEGCVLAGALHQKCSHVSLHVNKWFRSGSPPPAKCCAHWGWTKFQCLCWHAVHPYWPVAVNSLSAQSCMPSPSGRNIPGSSLHINPLLFPGPLNCVGGNPFSFPSRLFPLPTLETISVSLCLEMDGPYFVICEPHHDESAA